MAIKITDLNAQDVANPWDWLLLVDHKDEAMPPCCSAFAVDCAFCGQVGGIPLTVISVMPRLSLIGVFAYYYGAGGPA